MRHRWTAYNTLRNQMLIGFLGAMLLILSFVGIMTYQSVSDLLRNNAEKHIQQTAVQANGRLEAKLNQIDSLTTQVATDKDVQRLLQNEWNGQSATFTEKQNLGLSVDIIQTFTDGVVSVEMYTIGGKRLFPLDGDKLESKVNGEWIAEAQANKGSIVWFGRDPVHDDSVLAIRRINLIDEFFAPGGYLLIRIDRQVFRLENPSPNSRDRETTLLVDRDLSRIAGSGEDVPDESLPVLAASTEQVVKLGERSYMMVKEKSAVTGWTLMILTPVSTITGGITVLRTAIIVSAAIGTVLFFVLSWILSTMITRPVFRLIKSMRGARFGALRPNPQVSSTIEINELNHTYNQMVDNMNELIKLVYEKELLQSRTELKALQAQINPHFLFNTLEALYWSLQEKDESELAEFVVAMSDLFRYTITGMNKDGWVTLGDELEHIERYLTIMKVRFGDRLTWRIESPRELLEVKVPKLIIQPFVENAILHGMEGRIDNCSVEVSVMPSDQVDQLLIAIEDDGGGMAPDKLHAVKLALQEGREIATSSTGMGIANVNKRIGLYYGGDGDAGALVTIESEKGRGTKVTFPIPLRGARHESQ
jgi:two-component system, sensor histidine kinase YesM